MLPALAKLAQNGQGAAVCLCAMALMFSKLFPMMRRLFNAIVRPTITHGSEVWAPACSLVLQPELRALDLQGSEFWDVPCICRHAGNLIVSFANSERASRSTSSSGNFLRGPGLTILTHDASSCRASCAAGHHCLTTACIITFSGITLLVQGAHCQVPNEIAALTCSMPLRALPVLSSPLGWVLFTVMA